MIVYDKADHDKVVKDDIPMTRGTDGVWTVTLSRANTGLANLRGCFYNYKVDARGTGDVRLALDPYAPSMARTMKKSIRLGAAPSSIRPPSVPGLPTPASRASANPPTQ
jgi:hypothetical protein